MARQRYSFLDPELIRRLLAEMGLRRLFNQLLLQSGGDVEEAMRWMRVLQERGYIDPNLDLEAFFAQLLEDNVIGQDGQGNMTLAAGGERQIRRDALALTELILTKYPKDSIDVLLFGDEAVEVPISEIPYVKVGPYHTNTKAGLELAQRILRRRKHNNKQIFMITDGKPSALHENGRLYTNSFGLDMKIVNRTLEEADKCRRSGIPITTFMLATDPMLVNFVEQLSKINRGRAFYSSVDRLGEYILADYIRYRVNVVHLGR